MRKLGVGVLGVGEMGKRHAENLRRLVPEAGWWGLRMFRPNARARLRRNSNRQLVQQPGCDAAAQGSGCGVDRDARQISRAGCGGGGRARGKTCCAKNRWR